jgi:quercetin dioxygenase-like cupin family protein
MRRFSSLLSAVVVLLLSSAIGISQSVAVAQEATPAAEAMMPEGATFEPVTSAFGAEPPSPADMFVIRINLEPGGRLPSDPNDPSVGILIVESGAFTLALEGPVNVTRGAGLSAAMATAEASGDPGEIVEAYGAGDEVTLEAGDAAYVPANLAGEIRNEGQEPAVGLGFLIYPAAGVGAEATPAA